jgi:hypothetical protein
VICGRFGGFGKLAVLGKVAATDSSRPAILQPDPRTATAVAVLAIASGKQGPLRHFWISGNPAEIPETSCKETLSRRRDSSNGLVHEVLSSHKWPVGGNDHDRFVLRRINLAMELATT